VATVQRIFNPGVFKAGKSTHGWPAGLSRVWSSISRSSGTRTDAGQVPAVAKPGRSFVRSAIRREPTNYECADAVLSRFGT